MRLDGRLELFSCLGRTPGGVQTGVAGGYGVRVTPRMSVKVG